MPLRADTESTGSRVLSELPQVAARSRRMPLPVNSVFRYWVDPAGVGIVDGRARYEPVRVAIQDGVQNVIGGDPGPMDVYQQKIGRIPVPQDFEVQAWGETHTGYVVQLDLGSDRRGKQLYHYHDAWTRYEMIGTQLVTEYDYEGWADFCERVASLVGSEPHPRIVEGERMRLRSAAQIHRRMAGASPGALAEAEAIEARLTPTKGRTRRTA